MIDLSGLRASVSNATTVDASGAALIRGISQLVKDAIAADDLQDSAALAEVVTLLDGGTAELSAAISENTPAAQG
jgi:hypothetical protein